MNNFVNDACLMPEIEAKRMCDGVLLAIDHVLNKLVAEARIVGESRSDSNDARDELQAARQQFMAQLNEAQSERNAVVARLRETSSRLDEATAKIRQLLDENHGLREQLRPTE